MRCYIKNPTNFLGLDFGREEDLGKAEPKSSRQAKQAGVHPKAASESEPPPADS